MIATMPDVEMQGEKFTCCLWCKASPEPRGRWSPALPQAPPICQSPWRSRGFSSAGGWRQTRDGNTWPCWQEHRERSRMLESRLICCEPQKLNVKLHRVMWLVFFYVSSKLWKTWANTANVSHQTVGSVWGRAPLQSTPTSPNWWDGC